MLSIALPFVRNIAILVLKTRFFVVAASSVKSAASENVKYYTTSLELAR